MTYTPEELEVAGKTLVYLKEHNRITSLSNEDLAMELLHAAPVFGRLGELAEAAAERLSPGIVERLGDAAAELEPKP